MRICLTHKILNMEQTTPKTIEDLKSAVLAAFQETRKFEDPFSEEYKAAKLAYAKAEGELKSAEMAAVKVAQEAELAEKKNARLALNTAQLDAYEAFLNGKRTKGIDPAKMAEIEAAFVTAKEAVDNELLAKFAGSSPARKSTTPATDGESTNGKSTKGKTDEICWPLFAAGKTPKEVEAITEIPRSTVWFSYDRLRKANAESK